MTNKGLSVSQAQEARGYANKAARHAAEAWGYAVDATTTSAVTAAANAAQEASNKAAMALHVAAGAAKMAETGGDSTESVMETKKMAHGAMRLSEEAATHRDDAYKAVWTKP